MTKKEIESKIRKTLKTKAMTLITCNTQLASIKEVAIDDCIIVFFSDLSNFIIMEGCFDFRDIPKNEKVIIVIGQELYKNHIQNNSEMYDFWGRIKGINPKANLFSYGDNPFLICNEGCGVEDPILYIQKTNRNDDYIRILRLVLFV